MKIKSLKLISAALVSMCLLPVSALAEEKYKSAMFDFSGQELVKQLGDTSAIRVKGGNAVLYCQSTIDANGAANGTHCYDKQHNADLVVSTEFAIGELAFTPALVDEQAVPVRMSYRIAYSQHDGELSSTLIPNLGSMQERYGRDYIAPQERLDLSNWYQRYNRNSWVNGQVFLGEGPLSRVAATVDVRGETDIVRTIEAERAFKRDAAIVKNALSKSRFIPGFVNGRPVPMGYLAVVNYGDSNGEVVSKR